MLDNEAARPFSLLLVCTGNVCRSPAAERLLAATMGPIVTAQSAGTHALVGQPIAARMVSLLDSMGVQSGAFVARQLTERHIRGADLVLAMTRDHRAAVVELWPGAVRRSFTLREFARLLRLVDGDELPNGNSATRLSGAIPLAAAQRRQLNEKPEVDDIVDPYRRSDEFYTEAYEQIQEAVRTIASVIGPAEEQQRPVADAYAVA